MTNKARLRRLPASHDAGAGVEAGEHVLADFWRELGEEGGEVQEFVARQVALDLVAAQVADKDVADGEIPVAADRVVMIDGEVGLVERPAAVGASAGGKGLGDNRAQVGERVRQRLASSLGLVTVDVAGSAGERSATPPPGSSPVEAGAFTRILAGDVAVTNHCKCRAKSEAKLPCLAPSPI